MRPSSDRFDARNSKMRGMIVANDRGSGVNGLAGHTESQWRVEADKQADGDGEDTPDIDEEQWRAILVTGMRPGKTFSQRARWIAHDSCRVET